MTQLKNTLEKQWKLFAFLLLAGLGLGASLVLDIRPIVTEGVAQTTEAETVIVVDKKTNQLHLAKSEKGVLSPFKTWHTTLGQVLGDKMIEGDKKTPEGIYDLLFRSLPSTGLKPKFGVMALYVNYPNYFDKRGNKTGFDILIHGTDTPERLAMKYDSEGCVVLANENLEEVWPSVQLKHTRVIITRDFEAIRKAPRQKELEAFLDAWLKAWQDKDINAYIDAYADEFSYDKMNRIEYMKFKENLNKSYETIKVAASNRRYFFHEKYDVVTFEQSYESTLPGGKPGFKTTGRKNLYVQMRNGHYKIVGEELVR